MTRPSERRRRCDLVQFRNAFRQSGAWHGACAPQVRPGRDRDWSWRRIRHIVFTKALGSRQRCQPRQDHPVAVATLQGRSSARLRPKAPRSQISDAQRRTIAPTRPQSIVVANHRRAETRTSPPARARSQPQVGPFRFSEHRTSGASASGLGGDRRGGAQRRRDEGRQPQTRIPTTPAT